MATLQPGQMVEWVNDAGMVQLRGRIIQLSDDNFVSYDRVLHCYAVETARGIVVVAEKNLRAVAGDTQGTDN